MSAETLTERQEEIYEFIRERIRRDGYGPTVRGIGAKFDIRSPNGAMCHLKALQKKGRITRDAKLSRSIRLTDHPFSDLIEAAERAADALGPESETAREIRQIVQGILRETAEVAAP